MLNIALPLGETLINGEFGGFYLIETWDETRQLHENNYLKVNIFSFSFTLCSDYSTRDLWQMLYGICYKIWAKYIWSLIVSIGCSIFLSLAPHQYISAPVRMGEAGNVNVISVTSLWHIFWLGDVCQLLTCPVGLKCQHMKPPICN